MLPRSSLQQMAGPARPVEKGQVTHVVSSHKALLCCPCTSQIPQNNTTVSAGLSHKDSGPVGLVTSQGSQAIPHQRAPRGILASPSTLQEQPFTPTGAVTSRQAIGSGALHFSGPQFPQEEYEGGGPDMCQDSSSLKTPRTCRFLFAFVFCSVPVIT